MTQDFSKFRGQKVASGFDFLDPDEDIGKGIAGSFSTLHYKNQVFSLKHKGKFYPITRDDGSGIPSNTIDLIVVSVSPNISKVYYAQAYAGEASAGRQPTCKSSDGITPDRDAQIPQNKTCAGCSHNEWLKGGRGKECQDHKLVAVLLMPALTKQLLGSPLMEPIQMKIPPGSFNTWTAYGNMLRHEAYPIGAVLTRVGFDPEKQFCMTFTLQQLLTNEEAPLVKKMRDSEQTNRIIKANKIYEVKQIEEKPARIDTGLVSAFKAAQLPQEQPQPSPKQVVAQDGNGRGEGLAIPGFVERQPAPPTEVADSGSDLDAEVAALLAKKVEEMLK